MEQPGEDLRIHQFKGGIPPLIPPMAAKGHGTTLPPVSGVEDGPRDHPGEGSAIRLRPEHVPSLNRDRLRIVHRLCVQKRVARSTHRLGHFGNADGAWLFSLRDCKLKPGKRLTIDLHQIA